MILLQDSRGAAVVKNAFTPFARVFPWRVVEHVDANATRINVDMTAGRVEVTLAQFPDGCQVELRYLDQDSSLAALTE